MQREKLPAPLKAVTSKFALAHNVARDKTNEANRIKTELRNAIKDYWSTAQLPIGSFIRSEGMEFRYEANETSSLDSDAILSMYDKEEITREQFLRMLSIKASEAKNVLGADVVADLEVRTVGDKLDVRIDTLPVEQAKDEFVAIVRLVRKKVKRSVFGQSAEAREARAKNKDTAKTPTAKRRIKFRNSK